MVVPSLAGPWLSGDAFADRTALVVGVQGIGLAAAQLLGAAGARVALADIDAESARAGAAGFCANARVIAVAVDIRSREAVDRMVSEVETALGPIDIFINCAAVLDDKTFIESTSADWDRVLSVCLHGPMHCLHAVLPGMVARGRGRIVCLASDSGRVGQARLSYYAAAKGGLIALVKSVAQEVGKSGVTLNVVSPGATDTPLRQERERGLQAQLGDEKYAQRQKAVGRMYPVGRIGQPGDVAGAIAFLASDQAAWITGQVLSVNGGFVMP